MKMKISDRTLKTACFINIVLIILAFIVLFIIFLINNGLDDINDYRDLLFILYLEAVLIGLTLGLLFLIINIITLIKYRNIKTIIICLPVLIWVIFSYHFYFFGVLP
jgi:hypothetical protein